MILCAPFLRTGFQPESDLDEVAHIAGRIVNSIHLPMNFGDLVASVSVSIGIAMYAIDGSTPAQLLKSADRAMYLAKAGGKNTFRFCQHT